MELDPRTKVTVVVADVAWGWMDCTGSTVPESLTVVAEDTCDINECMAFTGDIAVAGASPAVFAGDAAVAVELPAIAGAASRPFLLKWSLMIQFLWPMSG